MKHRCAKTRRFGRTSSHKKALFRHLSLALLQHESIRTTHIKAKTLRGYFEPLLTMAKVDTVANRRRVFAILRCKSAVHKLFTEIAPRHKNRPGGYLRVLAHGFRAGDTAKMAVVQFSDLGQATDD